ncbi:DUF4252 domain-containing protein [Microbacter margulisiae]|uniref:DUF4252 domain-containing protein n=1 Tax=Microbacter margulisiae TaxID=1350067 RepID=A0A7W5DQK9_9PORP|nr:DUF4252 domain-containing protein [Microbacter margulisiae]MBB3187257.1 hypothetical protein [Microbacter margulisiae]
MKTKLIFLLIFFAAISASGQTVEKLIDRYANNKNCEYVSIQKGLFNLTQWLGANDIDQETKEVLSRIKSMKILTINLTPRAEMRKTFQLTLDNILKHGNFEKMMVTKNKEDHSIVYGSTSADDNSELIIESQNEEQLSLILMKGNLSHADLEKIAK